MQHLKKFCVHNDQNAQLILMQKHMAGGRLQKEEFPMLIVPSTYNSARYMRPSLLFKRTHDDPAVYVFNSSI